MLIIIMIFEIIALLILVPIWISEKKQTRRALRNNRLQSLGDGSFYDAVEGEVDAMRIQKLKNVKVNLKPPSPPTKKHYE